MIPSPNSYPESMELYQNFAMEKTNIANSENTPTEKVLFKKSNFVDCIVKSVSSFTDA